MPIQIKIKSSGADISEYDSPKPSSQEITKNVEDGPDAKVDTKDTSEDNKECDSNDTTRDSTDKVEDSDSKTNKIEEEIKVEILFLDLLFNMLKG